MKSRFIIIILTFCSFFAHGQILKVPVIIDTLNVKSSFVHAKQITSWMRTPFYVGEFTDKIIIGRFYNDRRIPIQDHFAKVTNETEDKYKWLPDSSIEFAIQDTQEVTLQEFKKGSYKNYKAIPVIIKNKSDSTIIAGYGYDIPVLIEALDKDGTWSAIESRHYYSCGVGLNYILLRPQNIACFLIPKYRGTFKTMLRLRLNNNYSNTFEGSINLRQFKKATRK